MSNGLARKPGPECTHYNLVQDEQGSANALAIERSAGGARLPSPVPRRTINPRDNVLGVAESGQASWQSLPAASAVSNLETGLGIKDTTTAAITAGNAKA